jgi:hypothetical protein
MHAKYHTLTDLFAEIECVGHSFAYVAHFFIFERCLVRTQRVALAIRRATNLATQYNVRLKQLTFAIALDSSFHYGAGELTPQSAHKMAMATFWRTFHHDGKSSLAW